MDKKFGLAVVLCMAILFLWWKVFPPNQPTSPGQRPNPVASRDASPGTSPTTAPAAPSGSEPTVKPGEGQPRPPEQIVVIDSPDAAYSFSSWGGTLRQVRLKDKQFLRDRRNPESGLELIHTEKPELAALGTSFTKTDVPFPDLPAWSVQRPSADSVLFRSETDTLAVEKLYQVETARFRVRLTTSVQNKTDRPLSHGLKLHLYGEQDPSKKGGGFFDYASANIEEMVCWANDKARRSNIESLIKTPLDFVGGVRWIAAGDKFFTVAAVPYPENPPQERLCGARALDPLTGEVFVSMASRTLAPGQKTEYPIEVFAGPKYTSDLEAVRPAGEDAHLADNVDVTFAVLSRPMLAMLKFFHHISHNWGIAIILLTIFVKLVTFYPTQRTMMSAKKMQRLAPEMAKLRKKYENDKQKLGVETMNLYKAHGVSPFGGCLPSLIQMPIWIALFSTLNYAVELHRTSFLYIADLSAKDPYYITPLLMGIVMFLQMRMSPPGADPQQQKMMAIMMPVMFTGFSLFLPAGLATYTLTSYLIGILQQLLVNYLDRRHTAAA